MAQPTQCRVCLHARVAQADRALASGRSYADVARLLAVSNDSVRRHVVRGHVAPGASAPPSSPPTPGTNSLANLRADLARLTAMDPSKMSAVAAMQLFQERRRVNVEIARLDPPPPPTPPEPPSVQAFLDILDGVIERHPEERAAFMAAWRAYRSRDEAGTARDDPPPSGRAERRADSVAG